MSEAIVFGDFTARRSDDGGLVIRDNFMCDVNLVSGVVLSAEQARSLAKFITETDCPELRRQTKERQSAAGGGRG